MKFLILIFFVFFLDSAFGQQTIRKLNVGDLNVTDLSKPCPSKTEAQRDAIVSPATGLCIYNTTTLQLNIYNGTIWKSAGSGISNWETAFNYAIGDVVIESNKIYQANTAHTSSVFATDIANWTQLANDLTDSAGILPLASGGTNKNITPSAGAIVYSDGDSFELTSVGASGQALVSNGASAPTFQDVSVSVKSQNGTSQLTQEIQAPGSQITQVDTSKHLVETGSLNQLVNPGFEHQTYDTSWTVATTAGSVVASEETSLQIAGGKKAMKLVMTGWTGTVCQNVTNSTKMFTQGLAWLNVSSDVSGGQVCSRTNSVEQICNDFPISPSYVYGDATFVAGATNFGVCF